MSFLKVKHNLWDSEGSNQQTVNDLFDRVCQNNYRICSLLFLSSLTWRHVFHNFPQTSWFWGHISQNPPHIRQGIQKISTHVLLWRWHHNSLWLIWLISKYLLYCWMFLTLPRGWVLVMININMIKAFCAVYIPHRQSERYKISKCENWLFKASVYPA